MAQAEVAGVKVKAKGKAMLTPYEEAMEALSLLIMKRSRADKSNKGDRFDLLFDYLKVDVVILEVVLGGKFDSTNVRGVPAFTVPQPDEAMRVLEQEASDLDVDLQVASPLEAHLLNAQKFGLLGEDHYTNAGLAVALCCAWLQGQALKT